MLKAIAQYQQPDVLFESNRAALKSDPTIEDSYEALIGNIHDFTDAEMLYAVEPDRVAEQDAEFRWQLIFDNYPPVTHTAIKAVLDTPFEHLRVLPMFRMSDAEPIGATIEFFIRNSALLDIITELDKFDALCKSYGVPSIQFMCNLDIYGTDYDWQTWADYIVDRYGMIKDVGVSKILVYSPVDVNMWAQRQGNIIREDMVASIDADIAFKSTTFQADKAARDNVNEALTAVNNGWRKVDAAGFTWRDKGNADVSMNKQDLSDFATLMADQKNDAIKAAYVRKDALVVVLATTDDDATKITNIKAV